MQKIKRFVLPLMLLFLIIYVYGGNIGMIGTNIEQATGDDTVGGISDGIEIEQSFYSTVNNINGFSIKLGTYMRENQGELTIGIKKTRTEKVIYSTTVKAESIIDNAYFDYRFPPIKHSKGVEYTIFISSNGSPPSKSITAYKSPGDSYINGKLFRNGDLVDGDLVFKVVYNRTLF